MHNYSLQAIIVPYRLWRYANR